MDATVSARVTATTAPQAGSEPHERRGAAAPVPSGVVSTRPEPLGWLASVAAVGLMGGKATSLPLARVCELLDRGVTGRRRAAALQRRLSALLHSALTADGAIDAISRSEARSLLDRITAMAGPPDASLIEPARRLALSCATPSQLEAVGAWLGPSGEDLVALGRAEAGEPTLAVVDIEARRDGTVTEVAVVVCRADRVLGEYTAAGVDTEALNDWLDGAVCVAHNGDAHDFAVLERHGVTVPTARLDTLAWSWIIDPTAEGHSLAAVAERFGVAIDGSARHTALGDARLLAALAPRLRSAVCALTDAVRAAIAVALVGVVHEEVLGWVLDPPATTVRWLPPAPARRVEGAVGPRDTTRRLVEHHGSLLPAALLRDDTVVVVPELRAAMDAVPADRRAWRVLGSEVIDAERLATGLSGSGWAGALGVRLVDECAGIVTLGPPAARETLKALARHDEAVLEIGDGVRCTDLRTLAVEPPEAPIVVVDPVACLFDTADDEAWFDPAAHEWPVTLVGDGLLFPKGAVASTMTSCWERVLGGTVTHAGATRKLDVQVCVVTGLPRRGGATGGAHLAHLARLAAARTTRCSTVLVTTAARRDAVADALWDPWWDATATGVLRPPLWPSYAEARRRCSEQPHLAVVTNRAARQLAAGTDMVVDRIGAPSLDHPLVRRMLDDLTAEEDAFAAVVEPLAALRLRRLLGVCDGSMFVCDPIADSPLLRAVLAGGASAWSARSIEDLVADGSVPSSPVDRAALAFEAVLAATAGPGVDDDAARTARSLADEWAARLLPAEAKMREFQRVVLDDLLGARGEHGGSGGHDALAVFRTGQGKSLCFQVAGLALADVDRGATVVVSPLIALQRDQVAGLRRRGVFTGTAVHSQLDTRVREAVLRGVEHGFYSLVYVAPEGLRNPGLVRALQRRGVALFVIDEAHCITEMGHDFRPDYRTLPEAFAAILGLARGSDYASAPGRPPVLALTGTASPAVRHDIVEQLRLRGTIRVDQQFRRPELTFAVRHVGAADASAFGSTASSDTERWNALLDELRAGGRPALVYTQTVREAEEIAHDLAPALGEPVAAYHADLPAEARTRVELDFLEDRCPIVVATKAFGMGIDKDDVKLVVHWRMPGSPEALYQEAGRAGRGEAGRPARCVVLYHPSDLRQAAAIARTGVPTRAELDAVFATLEEMANHHEHGEVIVVDDDLRRLAGLRGTVDPAVAIAHLSRAGLVREVDRVDDVVVVARIGEPPDAPRPPEEQAVLRRLPVEGQPTRLARPELLEDLRAEGVTTNMAGIDQALASLERAGVVRRVREVIVRPLASDVRGRVTEAWEICLKVARALWRPDRPFATGEWDSVTVTDTGVARHDLAGAIEAFVAFGCIESAGSPPDGRLPRVRVARRHAARPREAFRHLTLIAEASAWVASDAAASAREDGAVDLADLAVRHGIGQDKALDALLLAHLFNAISLDPQGWQHERRTRARVLALVAGVDAREALLAAEEAALARAHEADLRRQALQRYAEIQPVEGADAYQAFLERYFTEPDFLDVLRSADLDGLLSDLNAQQRQAVVHSADRLAIVAGAGTGKTRTLTRRIAHRVLSGRTVADQVLAVTFTRAATAEMAARLAQLGITGVRVDTLNALGWRIVRDFWPLLDFEGEPKVISDKPIGVVNEILRRQGVRASVKEREELAKAIHLAKANLVTPEEYPGARPGAGMPEWVGDIRVATLYADYERLLRERGEIDLDDQVVLAWRLLTERPDVQRAVLGTVRDVFVDEAQDLNRAQWQLVGSLVGRVRREENGSALPPRHISVVGDPRQAIYEWDGANPAFLLGFANGAETTRLDLVHNYRSTPQILEPANLLMAHQPALTAERRSGPPVAAVGFRATREHDAFVVDAVRGWIEQGVADDEVAVLAWTNDGATRVYKALRRAGVPARRAGQRPLHRTEAFRVAKSRLPDHPLSRESLVDALDAILDEPEVAERLAGAARGVGEGALDDWWLLRAELEDVERSGIADPGAALAAVERRSRDEDGKGATGVVVSTVHQAKGLEWDAVVVAAAEAFGWDDEARRVFYVALTRARTHLVVTWAGQPPQWVGEAGLGL